MPVTVFGIRHHGPGSARSLRAALEELEPDALLVEGPPDADGVVELAGDTAMRPPVALLVHIRDQPHHAAFWPLAVFSPEWQAITYALEVKITLRFIDLPAANWFALDERAARGDRPREQKAGKGRPDRQPQEPGAPGAAEAPGVAEGPAAAELPDQEASDGAGEPSEQGPAAEELRGDPLTWLAHAAGYGDAETWWEDMVEQRPRSQGPFDAITEAIAALRAEAPTPPRREQLREAAMRQRIRQAAREGHQRIAVVCGAWHAPALASVEFTATGDRALLTSLPKARVTATWVPWTHDRLSQATGYGAGVTSPGWYDHLFTTPDDPVTGWLTRTARLLRDRHQAAPPASVVEAVRLAEALAGLRGRPLPGLEELLEATRATLTGGSDLPLALIRERLIVGEEIGAVPDHTPMVPLAADLARQQRSLRLKPTALPKEQRLDLRRGIDRDRSALLHRLDLLGVPWGQLQEVAGATGTFREHWELAWQPELSVRLIEASRWGTTVAAAATTRARELAHATADATHGATTATEDPLARLSALAERCLLADLGEATGEVMRALGEHAAVDRDAAHLLSAIPPLARVLRYGDVRQTDTTAVETILDGLVVRACISLPLACASLDDAAARDMLERIIDAGGAVAMLDRAAWRDRWQQALAEVADMRGLHGLLAGRATRLLLDAGTLPDGEAARRLGLALSPAEDPSRAAAWVEGFLAGSGLLLLHDERLLRLLDRWLTGLPEEAFDTILPLLRRTFSTFDPPERRQLGQRVATLDRRGDQTADEADAPTLDLDRAASALATVALLLGVNLDDQPTEDVRS